MMYETLISRLISMLLDPPFPLQFYGIQHYVENFVSRRWTVADVNAAEAFYKYVVPLQRNPPVAEWPASVTEASNDLLPDF